MIRSSDRPLTFGSLFAGIGGIDLGFERAGMTCKWQVEISDYATRVLAKNWPGVRRWKDIRTFPPDTTGGDAGDTECNAKQQGTDCSQERSGLCGESSGCDREWHVDLICGGFPCQDISYAGRGAGLDGERSGLFWEVVRVVRDLGPKFVFLENVPALLTRGLDDVLGSLASLGYDAEWHCVQAADFGAPHIRDRIFIIAHANPALQQGTDNDAKPHEYRRLGSTASNPDDEGSRRRGEQSESREEKWNVSNTQSVGLGTGRARGTTGTGTRQENPSAMAYLNRRPSNCGWWDTEPDVGRVANGVPSRVDRIRGLGNAVVPQVAEYFGRQIVAMHARH